MKIKLHPLFFVSVLVYLVIGGVKNYLIAFFAVSLHELAHAEVAAVAGVKKMTITLMPYGAAMQTREELTHPVAVLLAGPLANLLIASLVLSASWLVPELYGLLKAFLRVNLFLAVLNLLPAYPLDGGRLFRVLFRGKWARVLTSVFTLLVGIAAGVVFCLTKNFSLLTFCLFLLCYFVVFCLPHAHRCHAEDPLFSLAMPDEEGRLRSALVKKGRRTLCRLSPQEITRLLLTYPADLSIAEALAKECPG